MTEAKKLPEPPAWPDAWDWVMIGAGLGVAALILWYWWRNRDQHQNDAEGVVVDPQRDQTPAPHEGPAAA